MRKRTKYIAVNKMTNHSGGDISVERLAIDDTNTLDNANLGDVDETAQTHRHDRHSFFLLESGTVHLEIDFQKYKIKSPSVIYIHPNQVHRTSTTNVIVSSWAINNENLNPEYLEQLEGITPAKPLVLQQDMFVIIKDAVSLCIKFTERKDDKLYHSFVKDSCNALVALVISQYLEQSNATDKISRFEMVTKTFRKTLEHNYLVAKRPADYARNLHISTPYLNECVKNATGFSVSHHIQQRIILEAKRLLYHSDISVKEIAVKLGYDDYPYFSRLFTKVAGMTPLAFRNKNLD